MTFAWFARMVFVGLTMFMVGIAAASIDTQPPCQRITWALPLTVLGFMVTVYALGVASWKDEKS